MAIGVNASSPAQPQLAPEAGASSSPAAEATRRRPPSRGRASRRELLVVFVVALGSALAMFHAAWAHPLTTQIGPGGDADEYSWFLSWVPFALGHGHDPLISNYVNFPHGINLMWNTSVLLPSLLLSPFTLVLNAAFSYNVLMTAAPVLTTTFSYMAFRRWTGALASLAGALVVGFSPYVLSQSEGHLAQTLIMSAPLAVVLFDRLFVVQASQPWRDGLLLGLLAWAQLLTGEEVLAMEAVTAAIALVVLCALARREISAHFPYAWRSLAVAAVGAGVLSAPFLAVQFLGPYRVQNVHPANVFVSDLVNFFVPTNVTKLAPAAALRVAQHFTGNPSEQGAYIGVPLVLFIALALVLARRRLVTWVALAAAAGTAILSMGPTLHWDGTITQDKLPYDILQKLPFFHNLLADRFASMMTVGVGLLVALGCEELRRLPRPGQMAGWALAGVGLAALFPITDYPAAASPQYLAFDTAMACPKRATAPTPGPAPVALVVPAVNEMDLRWQAEAKFCFVMPSDTGMTGTNSSDIGHQGVLLTLGTPGQGPLPTVPAIRALAAQEIRQLRINEIVVGPEWPAVPTWDPHGQAEAVAWVQWLLGQTPQQSHDPFISYVWENLPPAAQIASGHFDAPAAH